MILFLADSKLYISNKMESKEYSKKSELEYLL